ncbi:MAG: DUF1801 domain-containing protein, partial [Planctomycetes bacterium]|nr:DUF1801 domain-containing protein [Planctomycetota bacterium]
MTAILRGFSSVPRDPQIDLWLGAQPEALRDLAQTWFAEMRACGDDVRELMHDGCPAACVLDAPFAYVNVFQSHVNVGFYNGARLADPARLLQGTGKRMRHVKLKPGVPGDAAELTRLIHDSYHEMRE